uniref:Uncharacterized protein n=1 Tax=Tetraodon nigroviridis TaxID=99883 RepID=H3CC27_TETNG
MVSMATERTKSSEKVKNGVLGVLILWSIISLVVIVVWATSPGLKGSASCRAELQEVTEKLEEAKVKWTKDKVALEELLEAERQQQAQRRAEVALLLRRLSAANHTLEECRQEQVVLNRNITVLLETLEEFRQSEANLTAQLRLREDQVELLQENVTQLLHQTESCFSLKVAAESQRLAAESQTRACQSSRHFLDKQLLRCKNTSSSPVQCRSSTSSPTSARSVAPPLSAPLTAGWLVWVTWAVLRLT